MEHPDGLIPASFKPVHYCPIAEQVAGLEQTELLLNGPWRICCGQAAAPMKSISGENWRDFQVPGQWVLQGFDFPQDQAVSMARDFLMPREWAGFRLFLRFDAIHAGTHYWLNGKGLGYSENLFTPVEWEITEAALPGENNRIDLLMKVETVSEKLSTSSSYAGHNLGGIDRSVRIYALPPLHVSRLRIIADLDDAYRDGKLTVDLDLDNPGSVTQEGITANLRIVDSGGRTVSHSAPRTALELLPPGITKSAIASDVPDPLKWSAEKPNLYRLILELRQHGALLA